MGDPLHADPHAGPLLLYVDPSPCMQIRFHQRQAPPSKGRPLPPMAAESFSPLESESHNQLDEIQMRSVCQAMLFPFISYTLK